MNKNANRKKNVNKKPVDSEDDDYDQIKVGQQNAQKKAGVFPETHKEKYKGKPEHVKNQEDSTDEMEVLEENDYAGVRSINLDHRVTEKGSQKNGEK